MAVNLWPNADLESGVSEWTVFNGAIASQSSTQAWEQTYSLKVDIGTTANAGVESDAVTGLTGSTWYCLSFYIYPEASFDLRIDLQDQDKNLIGGYSWLSLTADTWTRVHKAVQIAADDTGIVVVAYRQNDTTDTNAYIDGVMLELGSPPPSTWVNYDSGNTLVVADCAHAHTADSPVITQGGLLTVADCAHAHTAGGFQGGDGLWEVGAYIYPLGGNEIVLETNDTGLSVADCAHAHTVESLALTQSNTLAVNDTAHIVAADSLSLGNIALSVDDAFHSMSAQNVTLTGPGFPSPDDGSLFIPFLRRKRRG